MADNRPDHFLCAVSFSFGIDNAGKPALRFHDSDERPLMHLTMAGPQPMIIMDDARARTRLLISVHALNGPSVVAYDQNNRMIWSAP